MINKAFDKEWNLLFKMANKYPEKISKWKGRLSHQAEQCYHLNSGISDFVDVAREYAIAQNNTLIVRNALHQQMANDYEALLPKLIATKEYMDEIANQFTDEKKNRISKFAGTPIYNPSMDKIAKAFLDEFPSIHEFYCKQLDVLSDTMNMIANLGNVVNPEHWLRLYEEAKVKWYETKKNQAVIKSYRNDCSRIPQDQIYSEKQALYAEFKENPLVQLHKKYHSDTNELLNAIRKGDFTESDFSVYWEYVYKLDVLASIDTTPITEVEEGLDNIFFDTKKVSNLERLAQLKQWLGKHLGNKMNLLFIPYYIINCRKLNATEEVTQFVKQVSVWYPDFIPNNESVQLSWCKALYSEANQWKYKDGRFPEYADLRSFMEGTSFSDRKRTNFNSRIQKCFIDLNTILKGWR